MSGRDEPSPAALRRTEWWLIRRGLPTFLVEHGFRSHSLPRMLPLMVFIAVYTVASLLEGAVDVDWSVPLAVATLPTVVGWLLVTRAGRRPPPPVPRWLATVVMAVYLAAPPVSIAVLLWIDAGRIGPGGEEVQARSLPGTVLALVLGVLVVAVSFTVARLATGYGVFALLRRGTAHALSDLRGSLALLGRTLPVMLFLTCFLFFTGEMWQLTDRMSGARLAVTLGLFAGVLVLATRARLQEELRDLEQTMEEEQFVRACRGTPLEPLADRLAASAELAPLRPSESRNILLVLATRQLVQAAVVGLGVFLFFVAFGLAAVDAATAEDWVGRPPVTWDLGAPVPAAMVKVAALLAGFSSMYFAVHSMTDGEYRQRFFASILDDISQMLAVRAVYRALHRSLHPGRPDAAPPAPRAGGVFGAARRSLEENPFRTSAS